MKRVLLISYYFPPMGMGGTQRMAAFARLLPDFGWQPTVLTVKAVQYFAEDPALLTPLKDIEIVRSESLDPGRLAHRIGLGGGSSSPNSGRNHPVLRLLNSILIPDNKLLWLPFAARQAKRLLKDGAFDAVLSSGPPFSSHLLAQRLAARYRLPLIADFRDGWAGGDFQHHKSGWQQRRDRRLQKRVLQNATAVTCVSRGLAQTLAAGMPPEKPAPRVITNGFDAADFPQIAGEGNRFDIVHAGTIGNLADPGLFLHVFARFCSELELKSEQVRLHFAGADLTGQLQKQVDDLQLQDLVTLHNYLPHHEALRQLRNADLLLYLVSDAASDGFVPGKTFEYLAARKPVLAMAKPVEGVGLLMLAGATRQIPALDTDAALRSLQAFYAEFMRGQLPVPAAESASPYERRVLTAELAQVLDNCQAMHSGENNRGPQVSES